MRLGVVEDFRKRVLAASTETLVHSNSLVFPDGLGCFRGVAAADVEHQAIVTPGGAASMKLDYQHWLNAVFGKVKNALRGTRHKASSQHLPRYLAEFCYWIHRRSDLAAALPRLCRAEACTPPMPYRLLKLAEVLY